MNASQRRDVFWTLLVVVVLFAGGFAVGHFSRDRPTWHRRHDAVAGLYCVWPDQAPAAMHCVSDTDRPAR